MELKGEHIILFITLRGQLDSNNNSSIRDHHTHVSEKNFEVLRELLSTSITGVHGNEVTTSHDKSDLGAWRLTGEVEFLEVSLLSVSDGSNLGSDDGKSRKRNSVELIEATPKTRLTNTFEDLSHISELVLIGTVSNDDIDTKCATHILDSLGLSSTGGSSRGTTIKHTHSLSKCDVTFISERSNTESLLGTQELIRVSENNISDLDKSLRGLWVP
jgi:hypothetical protein